MSTSGDRGIVGSPDLSTPDRRKLRSACDSCHQTKIKCSGGLPCEKCAKLGSLCVYSPSNRVGRPRTSRNKKVLRQGNSNAQDNDAQCNVDYHNWSPDDHGSGPHSLNCLRQDLMLLQEENGFSSNARLDLPRLFGSDESEIYPLQDIPSLSSQSVSPPQDSSWLSDLGLTPPTAQNHDKSPTHLDLTPVSLPTPSQMSRNGTSSSWLFPSSNTSATSLSSSPECSSCDCLRSQAAILVSLKELSKRQRRGLGSDAVLLEISRALDAWQTFSSCNACNNGPYDAGKIMAEDDCDVDGDTFETLSLATLSIRLAIFVIQIQLREFQQASTCNASPGMYVDDERSRMDAIVNDSCSTPEGATPLVLGVYRADPAETRLMSALLLFRALEKVAAQIQPLVLQVNKRIQAVNYRFERLRDRGHDQSRSERRLVTGMRNRESDDAQLHRKNREQMNQIQEAFKHLQRELQEPRAEAERIVRSLTTLAK